jgi:hypothetical protein
MRQQNNTFDKLLPIFAVNRVGWFSDGLVEGKTQKCLATASAQSQQKSDLCEQNVLDPDGNAYDRKEIELIQGFRFLESP